MTTEQLKLKFIFKSGRFTCNGEKFILDAGATKALNEKHGVHMNASVIWLVGNSPDGSSTCEERSYLCGKLREPIPGVKEPNLDINDVEVEESPEHFDAPPTDTKDDEPGQTLPPTTVEDIDKETEDKSGDTSTGEPETNEPDVKPNIEIVKAKEAPKKPVAKKAKPVAKKKSPVKKVVKK